jgi:hypothetical protein
MIVNVGHLGFLYSRGSGQMSTLADTQINGCKKYRENFHDCTQFCCTRKFPSKVKWNKMVPSCKHTVLDLKQLFSERSR